MSATQMIDDEIAGGRSLVWPISMPAAGFARAWTAFAGLAVDGYMVLDLFPNVGVRFCASNYRTAATCFVPFDTSVGVAAPDWAEEPVSRVVVRDPDGRLKNLMAFAAKVTKGEPDATLTLDCKTIGSAGTIPGLERRWLRVVFRSEERLDVPLDAWGENSGSPLRWMHTTRDFWSTDLADIEFVRFGDGLRDVMGMVPGESVEFQPAGWGSTWRFTVKAPHHAMGDIHGAVGPLWPRRDPVPVVGVESPMPGQQSIDDLDFAPLTDAQLEAIEDAVAAHPSSGERIVVSQLVFDATNLIVSEGKVSVASLQRNLGVGFGRASALLAELEGLGVTGRDQAGKRTVLVQANPFAVNVDEVVE